MHKLSTQDIACLNVIYVLCRNDEPRRPKDVAQPLGCSHQQATAWMRRLVRERAARWEKTGGCRPTKAGVKAMREHFSEWREVFSEADDTKAIGK